MANYNIADLAGDLDALNTEVATLAEAIAASESEIAAARAELDELIDGASVLQAMAEERAAKNRLTLLRRRQADAQRERNRVSLALERARLDAIKNVVDETIGEIGDVILAAYTRAVAARDRVDAAQRDVGLKPVSSPFDAVCAELEAALARVGGTVLPDSTRSVTVMYGQFTYTRRPIGWVQPPQPIKWPKVGEDDVTSLARRLRERKNQND